jgi:dTDP-4-dehydrorhamnose reductase
VIRGIVSGGQTGVDRAALDVAMRVGVPCDGWCPAGRRAEDGGDTDATLLLTAGEPRGGSARAVEIARRFQRPLLLHPLQAGPAAVIDWLGTLGGPVLLNVAGPRESEAPGSYESACDLLEEVLTRKEVVGESVTPPHRALVTGSAGLLGAALLSLAPPGCEVHGTVRNPPAQHPRAHAVELSDPAAVAELIDRLTPRLVIHTAYSMRDGERDILSATRSVVDAVSARDIDLIHLSSDTVLDGVSAPYDEAAPLAPVSGYGRWKAEAEEVVRSRLPRAAVVRPSLIVALDPPDPRTEWIRAGLLGREPVTLFVDELRTPILAADLARQIWEIARLEPARRAGVWHLGGPESVSRFALGTIIAAGFGLNPDALAAGRAADFPEPRPRDLRLLTRRADRELLTRAHPISAAVSAHRDRRAKSERPTYQDLTAAS